MFPVLARRAFVPRTKVLLNTTSLRRSASTSTARTNSWRGAALRWGLAGAAVYYYNTSSVFAEEPHYDTRPLLESAHDSETHATVDSIAEQRRAQARVRAQPSPAQTATPSSVAVSEGQPAAEGGPAALEEEASEQGAFNEETGEINWDCPCLGGMAHGPCGEQFRAAFSCFVFSKEEPKGVDCIEHFKNMQNCFREYPEIYGGELDDEEGLAPDAIEAESVPASSEAHPTPPAAPPNKEAPPTNNSTKDQL